MALVAAKEAGKPAAQSLNDATTKEGAEEYKAHPCRREWAVLGARDVLENSRQLER